MVGYQRFGGPGCPLYSGRHNLEELETTAVKPSKAATPGLITFLRYGQKDICQKANSFQKLKHTRQKWQNAIDVRLIKVKIVPKLK
jgi:hypothetical protein